MHKGLNPIKAPRPCWVSSDLWPSLDRKLASEVKVLVKMAKKSRNLVSHYSQHVSEISILRVSPFHLQSTPLYVLLVIQIPGALKEKQSCVDYLRVF